MPSTYRGLFSQIYDRPAASSTAAGEGSPADEMARENYLAALRSPAPVNWYSDHLKESVRLTGPVYVAIKVLCEQARVARPRAYRWEDEARMGNDQEHREALFRRHPLCRMLTRPNPRETGGSLRYRRVQQLMLTGTTLLWQVKNGHQAPREMWSVPTGTYQPVPPSAIYPDGAYRIMPFWPGPLNMMPGAWNQGGVVVPARYITAARFPHPLVQQEGLSPLTACSLSLDTLNSIEQGRLSKTQNAAHPSAVVEQDPMVNALRGTELTRTRAELMQLFGGPWKAGAIALLGPGLKIAPYGDTNIEAGWVQSWEQLVGFVMSVFGVSKSLAFMNEDTSYAILYAALKQFNLFTLIPLLELLADADNLQCVWPYYGEDHWIEYEPKPIDDEELRERQINTDLTAGIRTINEVRSLRRLGMIDEPWGEERAITGARFAQMPGQQGMPGAAPGQVQQPGVAPEKDGADDQLTALLEGTAGNSQPNKQRQSSDMERSRPTRSGAPQPPVQGKSYSGKFHSRVLSRVSTNGYH